MMGWKSVKEHYRIGHLVHVRDGNLMIGSEYVSEIISISPDGRFLKRYDRSNGDLARYQREIEADVDAFVQLFAREDAFSRSLPVFTFHGGEIVEKACEERGWPNVTHDGSLMYGNEFFPTYGQALEAARSYATSVIESLRSAVAEAEGRAATLRGRLETAREDLRRLDEAWGR